MKPENAPRIKGWLTASEVSKELGISRQTTNQMIHNGDFKTLHLTGLETKPQYMIRTAEVEKMKKVRSFPRSKSAISQSNS